MGDGMYRQTLNGKPTVNAYSRASGSASGFSMSHERIGSETKSSMVICLDSLSTFKKETMTGWTLHTTP